MGRLSRVLYDFYFKEGLRGYGSAYSELVGLIIAPMLRSDYNLLDIGCGMGYWVGFASQCVNYAIGIDVSLPLLRKAKSSIKNPNIDFIHASWDALPFREESFDVVIWFDGPEHAINPMHTLFNIGKVFKRYLFVSAPVSTSVLILPEYLEAKLNRILALVLGKPFPGHINAYTPMKLWTLVESSGLNVHAVQHEKPGVPRISFFKQIILLLRGFLSGFRKKELYWNLLMCTHEC